MKTKLLVGLLFPLLSFAQDFQTQETLLNTRKLMLSNYNIARSLNQNAITEKSLKSVLDSTVEFNVATDGIYEKASKVQNIYNAMGRTNMQLYWRSSTSDTTGKIFFKYDSSNRLSKVILQSQMADQWVVLSSKTFTYANNRVIQAVDSSLSMFTNQFAKERTLTFTYNASNQLTEILSSKAATQSFTPVNTKLKIEYLTDGKIKKHLIQSLNSSTNLFVDLISFEYEYTGNNSTATNHFQFNATSNAMELLTKSKKYFTTSISSNNVVEPISFLTTEVDYKFQFNEFGSYENRLDSVQVYSPADVLTASTKFYYEIKDVLANVSVKSNVDLLSIFPVPCNNRVTVQGISNSNAGFKLIDQLGHVKLAGDFMYTSEIDVTGIENGIYFLVIDTKNEQSVQNLKIEILH